MQNLSGAVKQGANGRTSDGHSCARQHLGEPMKRNRVGTFGDDDMSMKTGSIAAAFSDAQRCFGLDNSFAIKRCHGLQGIFDDDQMFADMLDAANGFTAVDLAKIVQACSLWQLAR